MNRPNPNRRHADKATVKKRKQQRRFDAAAGAGPSPAQIVDLFAALKKALKKK